MKKLTTLLFVLVFASSMAFAQNNDADVDQTGDDHNATVSQDGSLHEAIVDQDSHFGTGHTAEITQQTGDENFAYVDQNQANSEAYITQTGSYNESRSKQAGYNVANILQEGNTNVLGQYNNLSANAYQKNGFGNGVGDMSSLDLDQIGDLNEAGLWQEHHAEASIAQNGNENDAHVYQSGTAGLAVNSAFVSQNGNLNEADVNQDGEGNSASVQQGHAAYTSSSNTADIDQMGNSNTASFGLQDGDGNEVTASQDGSGNYSDFFVEYGNDNTISTSVVGDGNRTEFEVDADWSVWSSDNSITIDKDGDSNYVAGYVKGDDNTVSITQDGSGNMVGSDWYTGDGVNITGSNNTVSVSQMSDGNVSMTTVNGSNNTATITQN